MARKLEAAVWSVARLPPKDKLVELRLAYLTDEEEFEAYLAGDGPLPSVVPEHGLRTLAADCSISRNCVSRAIARLQQAGFLHVEHSERKDRPSRYVVQPEALEAAGGFKLRSHDVAPLPKPRESAPASVVAPVMEPPASDPVASRTEPRESTVASRTESRRGSIANSHEAEDAASELLLLFSLAFERRVGEPRPLYSKGELERAAQLAQAQPLSRIKRAIPAFFDGSADRNGYYESQVFPFRLFVSQFDKVAAVADRAAASDNERDPRQAEWDRNARRLAEARKQPTTAMPESLKRMVRNLAARHETTP